MGYRKLTLAQRFYCLSRRPDRLLETEGFLMAMNISFDRTDTIPTPHPQRQGLILAVARTVSAMVDVTLERFRRASCGTSLARMIHDGSSPFDKAQGVPSTVEGRNRQENAFLVKRSRE